MVLRKMCILWIWGRVFCKCLLDLLGPDRSLSPGYPFLTFCLDDLSNIVNEVLKSINCCCNRLASILLKIFASVFIMDIGLKFSILVGSLPGFGIRMMLVS